MDDAKTYIRPLFPACSVEIDPGQFRGGAFRDILRSGPNRKTWFEIHINPGISRFSALYCQVTVVHMPQPKTDEDFKGDHHGCCA